MRSQRSLLPTIGLALAAVGVVAACAGPTAASAPATPTTSVTGSATAGPTTAPPTRSPAASPATSAAAATGAAPATDGPVPGVEPVNCGKVGPDGGAQVDLIADSTSAGRVGCTEAINVISVYYQDAPTKSEGTLHRLVVQGWDCAADTGASGSGSIFCGKDGLAFHTQP
jgi:hypothetical protein